MESQKLDTEFRVCRNFVPLNSTLFQGQLYFHLTEAKSMARLNIVKCMKEEHMIWETGKQINEHLEALRKEKNKISRKKIASEWSQ